MTQGAVSLFLPFGHYCSRQLLPTEFISKQHREVAVHGTRDVFIQAGPQ